MPRIIHVGTKRPMARKHSSTGGVTYPKSPNDAARRRAEDRRYEAAKTKYLVKQRAAENASARQDAARTAAMREKGTTDRAKIAARSALASAYVQSGRTPPTGTMSTGGDSQQNKAMQAIAKRKRVGERALKYESALKQRGGINPKRSTGAKLRPVSSFAFNAPVADVERVAQQHGITELPVDARFDTANQRALRLKIYGMSRAAQNRQVATSFRQDAEARFPAIQQGQGLGSGVSPATTQAINQNIGGASADLDRARRFATPTEPGYQLTGVDDRIAAAWDQLGQAGPLQSQDYTQLANVARRPLGAAMPVTPVNQSLNQPAPVPGSPTYQQPATPQPERTRLVVDPNTGQMVAQAPPINWEAPNIASVAAPVPSMDEQARRRAAMVPPAPVSQVDTTIPQGMTPEQAMASARRLLPMTAANADLQIPSTASGAGVAGSLLPMTHKERIMEMEAKNKSAATAMAMKDLGLDIKTKGAALAATKPPPAVAGVEQTIANVIDAIDAPGFFDRLVNVLSAPAGRLGAPLGTPDAAVAEQTANRIEQLMRGMSAEDRDTAIASFRDGGTLKQLQELRVALNRTWDRTTNEQERAMFARTRSAVDRMLAAMTGG